ncbi:hypothetical protein CEP54_002013 [Fusarium duplospermum]|uniref:Uncharacterized protein n=1 Tax=Fusarium duplospermum TaxID=1325734 RepID=A0A428QXS0_9HYPO|nr:hypothetical protein CEP54_002013 [Fusarium duplospermum]
MLARDPASENETEFSRYPLTQYSLVCRDWQIFFERYLYRHLTLDRTSLWDFGQIVCRQRRFVEHIRLIIGMETYVCLACARFNRLFLAHENMGVSEELMQLFRILSRWRPGFDCPKDVTLEITGYPRTKDGCVRITPGWPLNNPEHLNARYQGDHLGRRLEPDFGQGLAQVRVVRKLVVPRKSRYRLSRAIEPMIQSLPNLYHKTVAHDDDTLDTVAET